MTSVSLVKPVIVAAGTRVLPIISGDYPSGDVSLGVHPHSQWDSIRTTKECTFLCFDDAITDPINKTYRLNAGNSASGQYIRFKLPSDVVYDGAVRASLNPDRIRVNPTITHIDVFVHDLVNKV